MCHPWPPSVSIHALKFVATHEIEQGFNCFESIWLASYLMIGLRHIICVGLITDSLPFKRHSPACSAGHCLYPVNCANGWLIARSTVLASVPLWTSSLFATIGLESKVRVEKTPLVLKSLFYTTVDWLTLSSAPDDTIPLGTSGLICSVMFFAFTVFAISFSCALSFYLSRGLLHCPYLHRR